MVTVLRDGALRVVIYIDDHEPEHVHVFGDGETKIALNAGATPPSVVRIVRASRPESRRALAIVREHRDEPQRRWDAIHG